MSGYLKKLWNEYGVGAIIVLLIVAYGVNLFANYLTSKGSYGPEFMSSQSNPAYGNGPRNSPGSNSGVNPSESLGQNEVFSEVSGISTPYQGGSSSYSSSNIQNPADLLPKGDSTNSQPRQPNPTS